MWLLKPVRHEVCRRCQLRQTLRALRRERLPWAATQNITRSFSLQCRQQQDLRRDGSVHRSNANDAVDHDGFGQSFQEEYGTTPPLEPLPSAQRYHDQVTVGARRSGDRKRGGVYMKRAAVNFNKIALDFEALGRPQEILRLDPTRDPSKRSRQSSSVIDDDRKAASIDSASSVDFLELAAQGLTTLRPEEIIASVDSVKDDWMSTMDPNEPPSQKQCSRIFERISECFTIKQLEYYLEHTANVWAEDIDDLQGVYRSNSCYRSRWYVGRSDLASTFSQRLEPSDLLESEWRLGSCSKEPKKHSEEKLSKKTLIIESIMRNSWKLRSATELNRSGEMDVTINKEHWHLLESRYDLFRQIREHLDVTVEYSPTKHVFRIRGRHDLCGQAFSAIFAPLRTVRIERLQLSGVIAPPGDVTLAVGADRLWRSELLEQIGAFTKSLITPITNHKGDLSAFDVMFLAPRSTDTPGVEMMIFNNVRRIIGMITSDQSSENEVKFIQNFEKVVVERVPAPGDATLPLHHRDSQWHRFRTVNTDSTKIKVPGPQNIIKFGLRTSASVLEKYRKNDLRGLQGFASPWWLDQPKSTVSLRTGYMTFYDPQQEPHTGEDNSKRLRKLFGQWNVVKDRPRLFISSLPGGISSFERLNDGELKQQQRIVIRLKPVVAAAASSASTVVYPNIVLELRSSPATSGAVDLLNASLVNHHPSVELSIPQEVADLQFSLKTVINADHNNFDPCLSDYVDQILVRNGRVDERSIPSSLEIDLPAAALHPGGDHPSMQQHLMPRNESSEREALPAPTLQTILGSNQQFDTPALQMQDDDEIVWHGDVDADASMGQDYYDPLNDRFGPSSPSIHLRAEKPVPDQEALSTRIPYQFSSIEYQSRLCGAHRGHPLTYTIVDAGGMGGSYEELVLDAPDGSSERELPAGFPGDDAPFVVNEELFDEMVTNLPELEIKNEQIRKQRERELKEIEDLRRSYFERLENTPAIQWFLPWFKIALDLVRRVR